MTERAATPNKDLAPEQSSVMGKRRKTAYTQTLQYPTPSLLWAAELRPTVAGDGRRRALGMGRNPDQYKLAVGTAGQNLEQKKTMHARHGGEAEANNTAETALAEVSRTAVVPDASSTRVRALRHVKNTKMQAGRWSTVSPQAKKKTR